MDPKEIEEMDDGYASGIGGMTIELPSISVGPQQDAAMAISSPVSVAPVKNITVYANSITPVSYGDDDPVVAFDVVFSVGIGGDGATKTYQVVKRIGVNRNKIATDAESTTPVSIVEAKKPLKEGYSTARMLALAGLK